MAMPCDSCRKPIEEKNCTLRCSGPCCGKIFHPFCGDLNQSSWKALTSDVGLYWYCAGCRPDVGSNRKRPDAKWAELVERIQLLESTLQPMSKGGATSETADDLLPKEVWGKIFEYVDERDLLRVRRTCRSWYRIVGGNSKLMDRFVLRFPANTILDGSSDQNKVLATSKSRFSRSELKSIRIVQVDNWWWPVAEHLQKLVFRGCKVSLEMLLDMLRPMVNLKCLKFASYEGFTVPDNVTVNFRLYSMERLTLYDRQHSAVWDVFRQLFPNLIALKLHAEQHSEVFEEKVKQFVEAVQCSVQFLKITNSLTLWNKIMYNNNLRLKGISLISSPYGSCMEVDIRLIIELSQTHPDIEHLNIETVKNVTDADLSTLAASFPNLKRLKTTIKNGPDAEITFLRSMPNLEVLKIRGSSFMGISNIELNSPCFECIPNVRSLSLTNLYIRDLCVVFDPRLKHLKRVTIVKVKLSHEECLTNYLVNLQEITINYVETSNLFLTALVSLSPNLTHVSLNNLDLDDEVVETMCRKLKRLTSLTLTCNRNISGASLEHIIKYCGEIVRVDIRSCELIAIEAIKSFKARKPNLSIEYLVSP